jgi:hypothetical protein
MKEQTDPEEESRQQDNKHAPIALHGAKNWMGEGGGRKQRGGEEEWRTKFLGFRAKNERTNKS